LLTDPFHEGSLAVAGVGILFVYSVLVW
jgi:hypothetical protein